MRRGADCNRTLKLLPCCERPRWLSACLKHIKHQWRSCGVILLHIEERARHRKGGASCRTSRTRSRCGCASEYAIDLGGHDEVVLMQSLDLFGLQRDRRVAPTEADIRMMAFGFREFTNLLNKGKRLPEIAKPEAPLDAVSFLPQLPVWGLCMKELSLLARGGGIPLRQGVQVLLARASVMLLAPRVNLRPHKARKLRR